MTGPGTDATVAPEDELVIRDPPLDWNTVRAALVGGVASALVGIAYIWLRRSINSVVLSPRHNFPSTKWLIAAVLVVGPLFTLARLHRRRISAPPSITVSRRGLVVSEGGSRRHYRWDDVRWFSIRPHRDGECVFVCLNGPQWGEDAVKLPRFDTCGPEELLVKLTERQRFYGHRAVADGR
jgi:hypothetical protein